MNKKQKCVSIIILIVMSVFLNGNIVFMNNIKLEKLSIDTIFKGYEKNIINGDVAIAVTGKGFCDGDKVYVNNVEVRTAVANNNYMSFLIKKEMYKNEKELKVDIRRFTSKGNFLLKSNKEVIKVLEAKETLDDSIIINEFHPTKINVKQKENLIDNKVALGLSGHGFSEEDTIYINGDPQVTAFGNEGFISCLIPRRYYNDVGNIEVQIKRDKNITESKNVKVSEKKYIEVLERNISERTLWDNN